MHRDLTGHNADSLAGGKIVLAFIPDPLPPVPPLGFASGLVCMVLLLHATTGINFEFLAVKANSAIWG